MQQGFLMRGSRLNPFGGQQMFQRVNSLQRSLFILLTVALSCLSGAQAEQPGRGDITNGAPIFPNVLAPFQAHTVSQPNLTDSARLTSRVHILNPLLSLYAPISL